MLNLYLIKSVPYSHDQIIINTINKKVYDTFYFDDVADAILEEKLHL